MGHCTRRETPILCYPRRRPRMPAAASSSSTRSPRNLAPAQGSAASARVLAADGAKVFVCDVGGPSSDAGIKLNSTQILRGGPVRLIWWRRWRREFLVSFGSAGWLKQAHSFDPPQLHPPHKSARR